MRSRSDGFAAIDGEPVLLADRHDGSSEPTAVVGRQPLGRIARAFLVAVQRRRGKRQVVQIGRETPAHGGPGSAQAGVVSLGIRRSRARCRTRYGDCQTASRHSATTCRPAGRRSAPRRSAGTGSRLSRRACIGSQWRPVSAAVLPGWMPGTRQAAAAESASGSSTWAKTSHRGSGVRRRRRSIGRSSDGSTMAPVGRRSPRMGRGIQGHQHQEHGQQAAKTWRGSSAVTIRCLADPSNLSPPPARISGSGRDQPTMGVHKQNTVSLRTSRTPGREPCER